MDEVRRLEIEDLPAELDEIGILHYDRLGQPISMRRFFVLNQDPGYRRVAWDQVGEQEISTVWLGHDLSGGRGPLQIFETMLLPECVTWRAATETEALRNHQEVLALVRRRV